MRQGQIGALYSLADSQVAAKFFNGGAHAHEDVQAFLRAVGDRPSALALLHDYAAASLRKAALREDGTLDPRKFTGWMADHADALQPFPELAQRFQTAALARHALDEAVAGQKSALDDFQRGVAKHFLGDVDPVDAIAKALRSPNAPSAIAQLSAMVNKNPDAREGLKRAVVDWMQRTLSSNVEAGETGTVFLKSDAFQTMVKKHGPALQFVFGPQGVKTLENIAADLQRANRSTRLPASSGTPQDLTAVARQAEAAGNGHGDLFSMMLAMLVEHHSGSLAVGMGGAIGARLLGALRKAGIHSADELVTQAMLNPELARTLMLKATASERPLLLPRFTAQMEALAGTAAARMAAGAGGDRRQ